MLTRLPQECQGGIQGFLYLRGIFATSLQFVSNCSLHGDMLFAFAYVAASRLKRSFVFGHG